MQRSSLEVAGRDKRLFGTSGIRGIFGQSLTVDFCHDVARALGTTLPSLSRVCIATDTRLSGEALKDTVVSGLLCGGVDVSDLGILPTPALALLTREMGFDAGVMITASHNPAEYNGIKLFNRSGIGYSKGQEAGIEDIYHRRNFRGSSPGGCMTRCRSARDIYFRFMLNQFSDNGLNHHLKVVIDPGNGAASGFATELFTALNLDVTAINDEPDGSFPGRDPEPGEDTLNNTVDFLRENGADLAVCFDGDADRVVFCDRDGFLGYNEMVAFLCRIAVKKNGKRRLVATVDTGRLVDMAVADLGGIVIRSETGDVSVAHLTRQTDAAIGVEPVGVYIQPEIGYFPDPMFAALTLLSHIKDAAEIRDFFRAMPPLHFGKSKVPCPNHLKAPVIRKLTKKADQLGASRLSTIDGLKLEFEDSWMLLRASGTEPVIRVIAESTSRQETDALLNKGVTMVADAL